MQVRDTVRLTVPVKVPRNFDAEKLASYLNKFIEVGLYDLHETVADKDIDTDEVDKAVAYMTEWGQPELEDNK